MPYTPELYALDRIHIADTIFHMYWDIDHEDPKSLVANVLAPRVTADYSLLIGKPPREMTAQEQLDEWESSLPAGCEKSHDINPGHIELPVPDGKIDAPDTCKAGGNWRAYMRRTEGDKTLETSGTGRSHFELVRGAGPGNPWRIKYVKAIPMQSQGQKEFFGQ